VASLGVQVHGGMGYIEETGAAQLFRDARIAPIYEGANGIQAIDLVTRKLPLKDGAAVAAHLDELRGVVESVSASNDPAFGWTAVRLGDAVESLARATSWLIDRLAKEPDAALAGARPICGCSAMPPAAACGATGAGGDTAWRRCAGAGRNNTVLCREFRRPCRRNRTHRSRMRTGAARRRCGASMNG